jgi:hypothetical protein
MMSGVNQQVIKGGNVATLDDSRRQLYVLWR